MAKQRAKKQTVPKSGIDKRLYTLDVFIISGPMTDRFVRENRVISRTIQIRGNQSLEVLHNTIFSAFDREDNHMYEFQIGGKGPMDPKARRYTLHIYDDDDDENTPAGDVEWTTIGSLGLKVDDALGYWFDFGDDWWHQINVVAIEEMVGRGKFPKVIKETGESPPQYVDWDDEDED
jgi:hypothetical protein